MDYQLPVPPEPEQPGSHSYFHVAEPEREWSGARLNVAEREAQLIADVAEHLVRVHFSPIRGPLRVETVDARMNRRPRRRIEERGDAAASSPLVLGTSLTALVTA